ncbi:hypothetical protein AY599_19020 [Leptolyngbya valderiana BDU 20041]|nr:hypothetical protein AY599_19020 [Leptolyngbya valderiana BDU 20041]
MPMIAQKPSPSGGALAMVALASTATLTPTAPAQVRLSHSLEDVVHAGGGRACYYIDGGPQTTADNRWSKSFTLADFGVDTALAVHTVEFGVEFVELHALDAVDVAINLYQLPAGSPPVSGADRIGSAVVTLRPPDLPRLEVVAVAVDATVEAGTALMVEIAVEDFAILAGGRFGDQFFIGGNFLGISGPSYVASDGCGEPEPIAPDCGFSGECNWVIVAEGRPLEPCRADLDGDGALTIFDFLTFQNLFDRMDPRADFDGDGSLTIFDFLAFQNAFDAGCP